ncbi:MAG: PQQ-binding-like beta-propeller repeat protein [Pirellulaceae bacterium]
MAHRGRFMVRVLVIAALLLCRPARLQASGAPQLARQILTTTGVQGGVIVHLGCGDGELTAALRAGEGFLVQGLDADAANVELARKHIRSLGIYGKVTVDRLTGSHLPLIDDFANLVVVEEAAGISMQEIMRVLCPKGVAYVQSNGVWTATVKPRPGEIDEWTHYLHDASNNAVAHDSRVGPPNHLQWVAGPRYSRHHDRMSSVSAVVSAGGRVFTIFDAASPVSILIRPKWRLIARDAFNGTVLWERPMEEWFTHLWPLKSGPAQLPRRLVASGDRVYVTLGFDAPLAELDAATGETIQVYETTKAAEEVILSDGVLFVLANRAEEKADYEGRERYPRGYKAKFWDEAAREIMAVKAKTGELLWSSERRVLPATLGADRERVVFHDGASVVCLDHQTGKELWRSEPVDRSPQIMSYFLPILVLYEDVVLFAGGETAGGQTGSWYESGKDTMTAFDASTGKKLWSAYHPPSGYRSPEDLLVVNGLVWTGETTSGRAVGTFTGRDPRTGDVKVEFPPDVSTYWFHHRCYRGKATDNYLLMSRTGTEFIDVRNQHWTIHHWFRGACLYGVMPANGLIYAPQHPCACYLESKLSGFNALAASRKPLPETPETNNPPRLEKGPAYLRFRNPQSAIPNPSDWPTYRHDAARSGHAGTTVPSSLKTAWKTEIGGRLTSPVVAGGRLFVASVDHHTVHAIDVSSGKQQWQYTTGGRVDSPPTIYRGQVLFGAADGWVTCLRASDGVLSWRFRAAPQDQRLMSYGQLESVWPVHGNVLIQEDVLYCVAGRSVFLDGGLNFWRLDPETGEVLSLTVLDEEDQESGKHHEEFVSWLNMPPALPDILSSDGQLVYMRSQPFHLDGKRLPLQPMPTTGDADQGAPPATQMAQHSHLFSPTGFVDDSWWHRTYWVYGSTFVSGWNGYFRAGKSAPSGRILVFDDSKVYGFGRKPQYYRWTTPIEHHLFAADKTAPPPEEATESSASVQGKQGRATRFTGAPRRPRGFAVTHHWTQDLPLLARAMVLADGTLFVAGPADLVDEEQAFRRFSDPEVQQRLAEQAVALQGQQEGVLWAVSASDGNKLAEMQLDASPVFDGMVAAGGRLYFAAQDGSVVCLAGD